MCGFITGKNTLLIRAALDRPANVLNYVGVGPYEMWNAADIHSYNSLSEHLSTSRYTISAWRTTGADLVLPTWALSTADY